MTFIVPPTFPPGPPAINAADLNQYVRDNQKALISGARAARTGGGTLPASTTSVLTFDAGALHNPLAMWAAGSPTRITVPIAGSYNLRGRLSGSASANCTLGIRKNGVTTVLSGAASTGNLDVGEFPVVLAASDYVELIITCGTGIYTLASSLPVGGLVGDLNVQWVAP